MFRVVRKEDHVNQQSKDLAAPSSSCDRKIVDVSSSCTQTTNAVTVDILTRMFNRDWFGKRVNLHYDDDSHTTKENEIVQIDLPVIEGHPKSSLLIRRDVPLHLLAQLGVVGNIVCGSKAAIELQKSIERPTIKDVQESHALKSIMK